MSNPLLNDKTFERARAGGAGAEAGTWAAPTPDTVWHPPIDDGPVSAYPTYADQRVMTIGGTLTASGVLFALLLVAAGFGWSLVDVSDGEVVSFPGWVLLPVLGAVVLAIVASFKPKLARIAGPVYALAQGVAIGAISRVFDVQYPGIVVQAVGATLGVFLVMLLLYATRTIRVTERTRSVIIAATLGVALFYLVSLVASLFGADLGFRDSGLLGIGISIVVAGVAALNLLLDFDIVERGVESRAPTYFEWYAAMGLLVTVVWLYLELLRLLAKLRD